MKIQALAIWRLKFRVEIFQEASYLLGIVLQIFIMNTIPNRTFDIIRSHKHVHAHICEEDTINTTFTAFQDLRVFATKKQLFRRAICELSKRNFRNTSCVALQLQHLNCLQRPLALTTLKSLGSKEPNVGFMAPSFNWF